MHDHRQASRQQQQLNNRNDIHQAHAAAANSNINGGLSRGDGSAGSQEEEEETSDNDKAPTQKHTSSNRPLILITADSGLQTPPASQVEGGRSGHEDGSETKEKPMEEEEKDVEEEVVDGIRYRIVAAVTAPATGNSKQRASRRRPASFRQDSSSGGVAGSVSKRLSQVRRKSSAFVSNLLSNSSATATATTSGEQKPRRMSIYEMTKSPPPETSLEVYLSERRRSSTISAKQVQQQLEQQSTFQTNYNQRQQYFKDLNRKLINQDKKLLNVVANRGQIHRHSVDIAQLPLNSAILQAANRATSGLASGGAAAESRRAPDGGDGRVGAGAGLVPAEGRRGEVAEDQEAGAINQEQSATTKDQREEKKRRLSGSSRHLLVAIHENGVDHQFDPSSSAPPQTAAAAATTTPTPRPTTASRAAAAAAAAAVATTQQSGLDAKSEHRASIGSHKSHRSSSTRTKTVIRKFQKLDSSQLSSTPAPDVKIGQRVAYKEYYGNEFGTIRWIGRVPQISPDWTVGVEFDNAIGEGDGSLHGRRYFIAKDCFAKFLPLSAVALVDQHVGRPEPGTMISVMAAASQPGQMISIQRVSTVHVQHCFLNAPHRRPGADILAVNTRLHCQCPNCGPCAHVIKPPSTQRIARAGKNATHMCQFSTYTCCGMESQEETMCTYTGNKVVSELPPPSALLTPPPVGNSWIEGSGYLSQLQAQQRRLMPEEYILGAAPEDCDNPEMRAAAASRNRSTSRRGSGRTRQHHRQHPVDTSKQSEELSLNHHHQQQQQQQQPQLQQHTGEPQQPEEHYAVACLDKADSFAMSDEQTPKASKVVYRNSIENRYLFPTDDGDQIDSTLEEDLENLSQARYGYTTNGANSRLRGSRGLFKSLRSLVSCLNSQNQSEFEVTSENTFRCTQSQHVPAKNRSAALMDHVDLQTDHERQQEEALYENTINRRPPPVYSSTKSAPLDNQRSLGDHLMSLRQHQQQISSSSDCGFSSASQNSINCLSVAAMGSPPLVEDQLRSQQIYRRIVARMMNNSLLTEEDLDKLKSLFMPLGENGCCLHNVQTSTAEIDQTIAEIASRSLKLPKDTTSVCHHHLHSTRTSCSVSPNLTTNGFHQLTNNLDASNNSDSGGQAACCQHKTAPNNRRIAPDGGSIASDSMTLSSLGSSVGNNIGNGAGCAGCAAPADQQQQQQQRIEVRKDTNDQEKAHLPKAFELKLTLSINTDGKQIDGEQPVVICKQNAPKPVLDIELRSPEDCGPKRSLANGLIEQTQPQGGNVSPDIGER